MNGHEHFAEAERLMQLALRTNGFAGFQMPADHRMTWLCAAQIHATLAGSYAQGAAVGRLSRIAAVFERELRPDLDDNEPFHAPSDNHPAARALAGQGHGDQLAAPCLCMHVKEVHDGEHGRCLSACGCDVYTPAWGPGRNAPTQPAPVLR
jgi:hypothetical protein